MKREERKEKKVKSLYSLIPLEEFKALMGVDDREDKLARFCLVTATLTIEQYCMRKFLLKNHFERIEYFGDLLLPLREYPVIEILAVYILKNEELLEPEFYCAVPDCGTDIDLPFSIELSPAVRRLRFNAVNVAYCAGYAHNRIPKDLSAACLELASWNMNRYRGRRIGLTGNVRGAGKEGEHFELSMPTNVCHLLEPYKRRVI